MTTGWLELARAVSDRVQRDRRSAKRSDGAGATAVESLPHRGNGRHRGLGCGLPGRSTALLIVENPAGMRLERDARLMQLVFFTLDAPTARGYDGAYQGENLGADRSAQSRRA